MVGGSVSYRSPFDREDENNRANSTTAVLAYYTEGRREMQMWKYGFVRKSKERTIGEHRRV